MNGPLGGDSSSKRGEMCSVTEVGDECVFVRRGAVCSLSLKWRDRFISATRDRVVSERQWRDFLNKSTSCTWSRWKQFLIGAPIRM